MRVGIVGLGLIGGSLARAFKRVDAEVYGYDQDDSNLNFVKLFGAIDEVLTADRMNRCEAIFLAMPTAAAIDWLREHAPELGRETLVIDCCGVKRPVCEAGFTLMEETEMTFVGGHPMAGRQVWGFRNSREDLFDGSTFVAVPKNRNDIRLLERLRALVEAAGFGKLSVMSAEEHDEIIALTSQLSHIIPSAFVKSDRALSEGCAVTGGSFRDMTRVASLDPGMWTDLCMENRDNLLPELDRLIGELGRYREALSQGNAGRLWSLFSDGSQRKAAIDRMVTA